MQRQALVCLLAVAFAVSLSTTSFANFPASYIKNNLDGSQTLGGHVPDEVSSGKAAFKYHASQNLNAQIILPLQNQAQLTSLLNDLYDPKSPRYHQFLTPAQFGQQFGPSAIDVQLIKEYLDKKGIAVASSSPAGFVLNVAGPVAAFEQAFGLHVNQYQETDGTLFFAPDTEPTIPATLAGKVLAVGGLDNLVKFHPHMHKIASNNAIHAAAKTAAGTGPGGYLFPSDVKTAYNLNAISSNGSGQNLALVEFDGYAKSDITAWEAQFGLPNVPIKNILLDGFNGIPCYSIYFCNGGAPEVTLDIEVLTAFAPGASNIFVYEAPNTLQGWTDEWAKIASDNTAKTISCSWGSSEQNSPLLTFDTAIFAQFAAQGQAVFVASGDSGAYTTNNPPDEPAVQPYVTSVGISALTTNSDGTYNSESASVYGGGGISLDRSIPSYQKAAASQAVPAAMVSTTKRNVPDVVLTADASTGYAFYIEGDWGGYYGSSISAPIWAAFMSLVNQGIGSIGPLGFANTWLYQIQQSSNYSSDFHDITTGNNGYFPAEPGFDDATGLGSFNGLNLYTDLVNEATSTLPVLAPTGLSATAGDGQVVLSWSPSAGATSYNVKRATVSGGPYTTIGSPAAIDTVYIDNTVSQAITYFYVVSAVNTKGESANSKQVSATPSITLPATPVVTASPGLTQVDLSWKTIAKATSYNVKRATVSGGPYTKIAVTYSAGYSDLSVQNKAYYYVVSAVDAAGESPNSAEVSATPIWSPPTNIGYIYAYPGNGSVQLAWTDLNNPPAPSYNIKRSTVSGGPYTTIANQVSYPSGGYEMYIDHTVTNGTKYYYVISAVDAAGESQNSIEVYATPLARPPAPTNLTATSGLNGIVLNWNPVSGGCVNGSCVHYYVKRSTVSGGPYLFIASTLPTSWTDNAGEVYGTTYYYVVTTVNVDGQNPVESPNSKQVSAVYSVLLPTPPTGLQATPGNAQVTLAWTAQPNDTGYEVYRATVSGGPYTFLGSTSGTSFNDPASDNGCLPPSCPPPPVNGTTYYYVAKGSNASGYSGYSTQVSATPHS